MYLKNTFSTLFDNPILLRELRRRMRGKRLIFLMILYIIAISAVSYFIIIGSGLYTDRNYAGSGDVHFERMARTGSSVFISVSIIQAIFVIFIAPLLTASVITNEKEVQTFDFLRVTTISPANYIWGCLISNFLYVSLIMFCALPITGLSFMFGGVGPDDLIASFLILLSISILLSIFGLMLSSFFNRTQFAQNFMIAFQIILAVLFLSKITSRIALAFFTSGAGATTLTPSFFTFVNFYITQIPLIVFWIVIFISLGLIFFVSAKRKIFSPDDRSLNYKQMFLFFGGILLFFGGFVFKSLTLANFSYLLAAAFLFYLISAFIFGFQPIEAGNDLWLLKKKMKLFRTFDEAPFFMLGMLAFWAGFVFFFTKINPAPLKGYIGSPLTCSLALMIQVFFLFLFIKNQMVHTLKKEKVLKKVFSFTLLLWLIIPVICLIIVSVVKDFRSSMLFVFFINLSPLFSINYFDMISGMSASEAEAIKFYLDCVIIAIFSLASAYLLIRHMIAYRNDSKANQGIYS